MSATGEQLTNAQVWAAAAQAVDRFMHKRGMGACICEAREIHAVADEIERLRAENAALREQHRQAHENAAALHGALADISTLTPLGGEVADPADVVAAVRALREALRMVREAVEDSDDHAAYALIDTAIDAARKAPPKPK